MKNLLIPLICIISTALFAHNSYEHALLKQWIIAKDNKTIKSSFMMMKDKTVYLEGENQHILKFPLSAWALNDQLYVLQKYKSIEPLDTTSLASKSINWQSLIKYNFWLVVWFSTLLTVFLCMRMYQNTLKFKYALIGSMVIFISFMPIKLPIIKDVF